MAPTSPDAADEAPPPSADAAVRLKNRLREKFPNASSQDVSNAIKVVTDAQKKIRVLLGADRPACLKALGAVTVSCSRSSDGRFDLVWAKRGFSFPE
jgi:hypothetical protein